MLMCLGLLAFLGGAAHLLSALRPKIVAAYAAAHTFLVAQGCWFVYIGFVLFEPLAHPLDPKKRPEPTQGTTQTLVTLALIVALVNAAAAATLVAASRRSASGAHAYLSADAASSPESKAAAEWEMGKAV